MATYKQRTQSFNQPPTRIFLSADFLQSQGDIRDDAVRRIRIATINAFMEASAKEGLTSTWVIEMRTKTPKDFDTLLERRGLMLPEPAPLVDAVDPVEGIVEG